MSQKPKQPSLLGEFSLTPEIKETPRAEVGRTILSATRTLTEVFQLRCPYLSNQNGITTCSVGNRELVRFEKAGIIVGDSIDVLPLLTPQEIENEPTDFDTDKFRGLIRQLQPHLTELNHFGIQQNIAGRNSFFLAAETLRQLQRNALLANLELFEETNSNKYARWMFLGIPENWNYPDNNPDSVVNPMFEIVLSHERTLLTDWGPHFQIDINTDLPAADIFKLFKDTYANPKNEGWQPDWLYDTPIGPVLIAQILGQVCGVKIVLYLGTKDRDLHWQRNQLNKID